MPEQPFLPFDEPAARPVAPAAARLIDSLARVCRERPLEEKVFVAPSLAIGHTLVERLAREGHPWMNLRVATARTIALDLVGPDLAREGLRLLSRAQALALVEQACAEFLKPRSYFGQLRDRPGFHRALQRTFEEIRAAGLSAAALPPGAFDDPRKLQELKGILARYDADLAKGRFIDSAAVLRRAVAAAKPDPGAPVYLVPEDADLTAVERALLETIAAGRLETLAAEPAESWTAGGARATLVRAIGEENEIRRVFREVLDERDPLRRRRDPLHRSVHVSRARLGARPRARDPLHVLRGRRGDLHPPRPGGPRVPRVDRRGLRSRHPPAGAGLRDPHLRPQPRQGRRRAGDAGRSRARSARRRSAGARRATARRSSASSPSSAGPRSRGRDADEAGEAERAERAERRRRRLAAAVGARDFAARALELSSEAAGATCDLRALARGCRAFVAEFARVAGAMDATALAAIEKLLEELEVLPSTPLPPAEAAARLSDAVRALSIDADRPRPGRVHVAEYRSGGFSGRAHTYLLGLDEARHPGADLEDPVLLDAERRSINRILAPLALPLYRDRPRESARALRACVARVSGDLTASYSSWNLRSLDQQSEQFPSPFFLDLYRVRAGAPQADYSDLVAALPEPAGFLPGVDAALDETEWWLSRLSAAGPAAAAGAAAPLVRALLPAPRGRPTGRGGAGLRGVHDLGRLGPRRHAGARSARQRRAAVGLAPRDAGPVSVPLLPEARPAHRAAEGARARPDASGSTP